MQAAGLVGPVGMDYDKTDIPEAYNQGRDHGPAVLQQWMNVIAIHVDEKTVMNVLDLGCGTGRFSQALATRFNAMVVGVDPSGRMLRQAINSLISDRVFYVAGAAEALPLQANSIDLIFISMVFHHFKDSHLVAQECRRVLRENGRVFLRTGSLEKISMYPYVPFFPRSRTLLEEQLPALAFQCEVFESASFQTLFSGVVIQQIAPHYSAFADKLSVRADSILASLDDDEFEAGVRAVRSKAATMAIEAAVEEPVDFVVFGKRT